MYHYIENKEFLKAMRRECADVVNRLKQAINADDYLRVEVHLVGSGARGLETQNGNEPVDLDYNLCINSIKGDINDAKRIKDYVKRKFNEILKSKGWKDCSDSTSALTTKKVSIPGFKTKFSIDLAIVKEKNDAWYRLIHKKTGDVKKDSWIWNQGPNSKGLNQKVRWIKENNHTPELRTAYLKKKNAYLSSQDDNHSSFVCYIEAVNEVYAAYHNPNGSKKAAKSKEKTVRAKLNLCYSDSSNRAFYCGYELNGEEKKSPDYNADTDEDEDFEITMHWLNKLVTAATKDGSVKNINVHTSGYVYKIITNRQGYNLYRTFAGRMQKLGVSIKLVIEK